MFNLWNYIVLLSEMSMCSKVQLAGWSGSEQNFAYKIPPRQTEKRKSKLNETHWEQIFQTYPFQTFRSKDKINSVLFKYHHIFVVLLHYSRRWIQWCCILVTNITQLENVWFPEEAVLNVIKSNLWVKGIMLIKLYFLLVFKPQQRTL